MAVTLQNGTTGLFDLQGKAFQAQKSIYTALGTTISQDVVDTITMFLNLSASLDLQDTIDGLAASGSSSKTSLSGLISQLSRYCENVAIELFDADDPLPTKDIATVLDLLIKQMEDNADSVDASTVTVGVTAAAGNVGDGVIVTTTKRGDGREQENALAEDLEVTRQSATSLDFAGEVSVEDTHADWPLGSGSSGSISVYGPGQLLSNGTFDDEDDVTNAPDDWIVSVGQIGTTIKMTDVEVQTVVISGTPTGGHYLLHWTNAAGDEQVTIPIAYNAGSSTVQSALRSLTGLGLVTVAESGTSPNLTHTVTFTGRGGNVSQLTSTDNMTGGTPLITHATTTAGTAEVYTGSKAMYFESDGAELTAIYQRVTLLAETPYAVNCWMIADSAPAAGVIKIELLDGIGGSVINDSDGNANSLTIDATDLTTSWQDLTTLAALSSTEATFRLPEVVPDIVYLKIHVTTAVTNTRQVFFDRASLVAMSELYDGGPFAVAFSGATEFKAGDEWTIAVTNDRAGEVQEYYQRAFGMRSRGLLLPSNSAGSETVADTVIS